MAGEREGRGKSGNIQHLSMESPKTICTRTAEQDSAGCDVFVNTHIITYIYMHVFNNNNQKTKGCEWEFGALLRASRKG